MNQTEASFRPPDYLAAVDTEADAVQAIAYLPPENIEGMVALPGVRLENARTDLHAHQLRQGLDERTLFSQLNYAESNVLGPEVTVSDLVHGEFVAEDKRREVMNSQDRLNRAQMLWAVRRSLGRNAARAALVAGMFIGGAIGVYAGHEADNAMGTAAEEKGNVVEDDDHFAEALLGAIGAGGGAGVATKYRNRIEGAAAHRKAKKMVRRSRR